MGWIVLAVVVLLGVFLVGMYNSLVQLRVRSESAWSDIDVQLKRRHDLIPNLVETVKGYAAHEKDTFENVTKARAMVSQGGSVADQAQAQNMLTGALKSLIAVSEAYPELKANQNFMALQEELTGTEGKISYARQYYNDTVMTFNALQQTFPTNLIAGMFGFKPRDYFKVD